MRESTTIRYGRGRAVALLAAWVLASTTVVLPFAATQEAGEARIDYAHAQQDILVFEAVLNNVINNAFSSSPFAVVQKAKGTYLPEYGVSLTFAVNIHRAVINTPFGKVTRPTAITLEMKRKRIEELKEKLIRAMYENGGSFGQLRRDDRITIVAFFEDRNFPDEPNTNKTIVLSAFKKDLDELGGKIDRLKEFRQRIKIVEY